MKKITITCLLFLIAVASFPQRLSVGVGGGYGSYSMGTLKEFQSWRLQQSGLPLKTTDNYPVAPFYRAEVALSNWLGFDKIGVFYAFNSTGARTTMSDYSGRVNLDALINGNQLGLTIHKDFSYMGPLSMGAFVDGSLLLSSLRATDYLKLEAPANVTQKDSYDLRAKGYSVEPGFAVKYVIKPIVFQLTLGYLLDFSGKLYVKGSKNQWLQIDRTVIEPDWSGLRMGLQCAFVFGS